MPVPIVSIATSLAPCAAPARTSAQTAQLASLSTSTGSPSRSDIRAPKGRSAIGRLTAWTAMPVRRSNVQGMPKPTASTAPPTAARTSSTASTTASISCSWSSPKACRRAR